MLNNLKRPAAEDDASDTQRKKPKKSAPNGKKKDKGKGKAKAASPSPAPSRSPSPAPAVAEARLTSLIVASTSAAPSTSAHAEAQAAEIARLTALVARHDTHLAAVQNSLTCQICLDLLYKPFTLAPCGHIACYACLLRWFTTDPNQPQGAQAPGDPVDLIVNANPPEPAHAAANDGNIVFPPPPAPIRNPRPSRYMHRRKTCPLCRAVVRDRPTEVYNIKDMVGTLARSELVELPAEPAPTPASGSSGSTPNANANPGNPTNDPWNNVFPPARRAGMIPHRHYDGEDVWDDEDDFDDDESIDVDYFAPLPVNYEAFMPFEMLGRGARIRRRYGAGIDDPAEGGGALHIDDDDDEYSDEDFPEEFERTLAAAAATAGQRYRPMPVHRAGDEIEVSSDEEPAAFEREIERQMRNRNRPRRAANPAAGNPPNNANNANNPNPNPNAPNNDNANNAVDADHIDLHSGAGFGFRLRQMVPGGDEGRLAAQMGELGRLDRRRQRDREAQRARAREEDAFLGILTRAGRRRRAREGPGAGLRGWEGGAEVGPMGEALNAGEGRVARALRARDAGRVRAYSEDIAAYLGVLARAFPGRRRAGDAGPAGPAGGAGGAGNAGGGGANGGGEVEGEGAGGGVEEMGFHDMEDGGIYREWSMGGWMKMRTSRSMNMGGMKIRGMRRRRMEDDDEDDGFIVPDDFEEGIERFRAQFRGSDHDDEDDEDEDEVLGRHADFIVDDDDHHHGEDEDEDEEMGMYAQAEYGEDFTESDWEREQERIDGLASRPSRPPRRQAQGPRWGQVIEIGSSGDEEEVEEEVRRKRRRRGMMGWLRRIGRGRRGGWGRRGRRRGGGAEGAEAEAGPSRKRAVEEEEEDEEDEEKSLTADRKEEEGPSTDAKGKGKAKDQEKGKEKEKTGKGKAVEGVKGKGKGKQVDASASATASGSGSGSGSRRGSRSVSAPVPAVEEEDDSVEGRKEEGCEGC
ncbi:hypothetical protein DFP72DRAFT_1172537 [Ephemerocybe angulata]|uniref:RING-type domain-containing protein n=1 Tax=Ephemerocybe angulata TaxID=980116 RepID=A0A8H6HQ79_9AGAR|nr:hypothetical protein DFP72DRAFT_1172537 [Tulosesus angulatus]